MKPSFCSNWWMREIPVCGFARVRGDLETLFMQITEKNEKVVLIHEG